MDTQPWSLVCEVSFEIFQTKLQTESTRALLNTNYIFSNYILNVCYWLATSKKLIVHCCLIEEKRFKWNRNVKRIVYQVLLSPYIHCIELNHIELPKNQMIENSLKELLTRCCWAEALKQEQCSNWDKERWTKLFHLYPQTFPMFLTFSFFFKYVGTLKMASPSPIWNIRLKSFPHM